MPLSYQPEMVVYMPKNFESWQFWHAARKLLGDSYLLRVLGKRNARTIRMYGQDPRFTDDRCRDPLEHLRIILNDLALIGRGDIARAAIAYLSSALDDDHEEAAVHDVLPTIQEEVLADYSAVARLQKAVEECAPVDQVKDLVREAKEEIDRTFTRYATWRAVDDGP